MSISARSIASFTSDVGYFALQDTAYHSPLMIDSVYLRRAFRRPIWATVAFLLAFAALLLLIGRYYLQPAVVAARVASAPERRQLSAVSILLLAILLTMLAVGLMLTFRVHRFFVTPGKNRR